MRSITTGREPHLDHVGAEAPDRPGGGGRARAGPRRAARAASRPARIRGRPSRKDARRAPRRCGRAKSRRDDLALPRGERVGRDTVGRGQSGRAPSAGRPPPRRSAQSTWSTMRVDLLDALGVGVRARRSGGGRAPRSSPPPSPVRPTVTRPRSRAARRASTTFGERPEVLMPRATSPGRPWASTCRRKTAAKPMSLPTAVTTEGSVVSAIAERPAPLAREAAHELGHEVLRVGRGAAVAEGEHAAAGEQALRHARGRPRAGGGRSPRRSAP